MDTDTPHRRTPEKSVPTPPDSVRRVVVPPEGLYRLLAESVRDYAIFMLDPEGYVATWNAGASLLKGYRAEEIIGRHFSVFYPAERVAEGFPRHELDVASREGRFEDEGWRLRKDGTRFWANVVITALRDEGGALVGFAKVTRDLTERRAAEEQARRLAAERAAHAEAERRNEELRLLSEQLQSQAIELEQQTEEAQALAEELEEANDSLARNEAAAREALSRFEGVFNSRVIGLSVFDAASGRTLAINDYLLELIGYTRDDVERGALDWRAVTPPEYRVAEERSLRELVERGKAGPFEKEYVRKDGTRVPVALSGAAIPGLPGQYAVFVEDLTERRRAEAALAERERQFRVMVDAITQLAWMARPDGYIDWYNARWYEYTGTTHEQMAGWGWQSVHDPAVLPAVIERWRASIATGEPMEMTFPLRGADGHFRPFLTRVTPVRDAEGRVVRWFGTNTDVEAERAAREAAERAVARTERLQSLTAALAGAQTVEDVAEVVVAQAVAATGAKTGMFLMREPDADDAAIVRQTGFTADVLERYRRMPLSTPGPAAESLRTGEPVWVSGAGDDTLAARFPALADLWERFQVSAVATVPLAAAGRTVGAISFTFGEPRAFPAEDREFFLALGRQAAQAVERARLFEAERAARADAEAARRRLAFLAEASARLAASLDVEATLRTLADLAVPALADWCFVEVREESGRIKSAAVAHQDPAKVALVSEILRRYPLDPDAPFGTGHVLRTGRPEVAYEIPDELLATLAQDAEHLALVRSVGMKSSISVPLFAPDGRPVAVLSLVSAESGRRFGPADLAMAEEVARRASVSLASARLYAAEQAALRRAAVLQRVTAALSGTVAAAEAAWVVLRQTAELLDAEGGVLLRTNDDGTTLEVIAAVGYPEEAVAQWRRFSASEPVPLAAAVRTREPVFVESAAAWRERFGERGLMRGLTTERSWAALPLAAEGRVLGVMGLSFPREGPVSAEDRAFVMALAHQCAQAFERARLFDAERAARAEAEAANRAKGDFLAVMSHELRTPLNAIGGYAQLLEMGLRGPVSDAQRDDLARIQQSQRHLLGLINQVLNYTRIETGTVRYDLADVPVAEAVGAAEALVTPQARAKGITFVSGECDPSLTARADGEKLRQILLNLLTNAIKFTDAGGRVTIACTTRGGAVQISVTDTGIGVDADKLAHIFEPFVQVDQRLTRPHEGVGLGLAISRDLARGMGGELTAESAPGAGSTFTLLLPAA